MSESEPMLGDMPQGGWINRLPGAFRPYVRLMRLDRPIGTWLLLLPCWWAITMAATVHPTTFGDWLRLMVLFAVGAVTMRGAGCTLNDILDRDLDALVARTVARPLANGDVSLKQAVIFLAAQLAVGLGVLVQLNRASIILGLCAVLLLAVYPLMKRLTNWPQAWLGATFNWGALLGWAAVAGRIELPALLLYVGGVFWTLGYDTIYAHQDKEDDAMIGVKSTALALGRKTRPFLFLFYFLTEMLFLAAGLKAGLGWPFVLLMGLPGLHLLWQAATVVLDEPRDCLDTFKSNRDFGFLVMLAIAAGLL